jgi:uncharacterized glyoxalase superfamily protein PhnB
MTTTTNETGTGPSARGRGSAETVAATVWPCVNYDDAPGGIRYLIETFGFEERIVVADGDVVHHAELRWPEGGGLMIGSYGRSNDPDDVFCRTATGVASLYVVTDQPDELLARARASGAEVVRDIEDTDYGSRGFTVRDLEGNLWSFGTYRGT